MHSLLSGASLSETITRIQNTVPVSVVNSCKIWPAVTAFMFWTVPVQYRNIFGGSIAIGWQAYLSLLNQRAAKKEGLEEGEVVQDRLVEEKPVVRGGREEEKKERQKCAA
jgi:protein Mpv17